MTESLPHVGHSGSWLNEIREISDGLAQLHQDLTGMSDDAEAAALAWKCTSTLAIRLDQALSLLDGDE